uniref:Uncharacterized protein n=1 Tax=Lygus hesperus TaxID=30085 RepID=A0A0A9XFM6_LYGHE
MSSEDAVMLAMFLNELATVNDTTQFVYVCKSAVQLHRIYLQLKYAYKAHVANKTIKAVTLSYSKDVKDEHNHASDEDSIRALLMELRTLQSTLVSKVADMTSDKNNSTVNSSRSSTGDETCFTVQ